MDGSAVVARLEPLIEAVTRAVTQRLGSADDRLVELVVREVVGALPSRSSSAPDEAPRAAGLSADEVGALTALGARVPPPPSGERTLALCAGCVEQARYQQRDRAVVTATGRNRRGIIAAVATAVTSAGGDIADISQTIVSDFFTMIMVVDIGDLEVPFPQFKQRVTEAAAQLSIRAVVMHEDVMRALQRV